jgi:hypothetical protein
LGGRYHDDAKDGSALVGQPTTTTPPKCKRRYRLCSSGPDCCSGVCIFLRRGLGAKTNKGICAPKRGVLRHIYAISLSVPLHLTLPVPNASCVSLAIVMAGSFSCTPCALHVRVACVSAVHAHACFDMFNDVVAFGDPVDCSERHGNEHAVPHLRKMTLIFRSS